MALREKLMHYTHELDPGVIMEVTKPNGKTYQYSIPQYTPGSGGNGAEAKQTEIGVFCIRDDVVQVVRCKDCRNWHTTECALDYAMFEPTDDSFCSYGERKDVDNAEG